MEEEVKHRETADVKAEGNWKVKGSNECRAMSKDKPSLLIAHYFPLGTYS